MANNDNDPNGGWVDDRLNALDSHDARPDIERGRARLRERKLHTTRRRHRRWTTTATGIVVLTVFTLPWPRAAAQRLWDRLTVHRIEIVQISRPNLPESVTGVFTMDDEKRSDPQPVGSVAEAERVAGFRVMLPHTAALRGSPELSVVKWEELSTKPLRVKELERALTAAGITDVSVPRQWEGTTLVAQEGPMVIAAYRDSMAELMQSPPLRMTTPAGVALDRFMEVGFRLFGRTPADARTLAAQIASNPAIIFHFPESDRVREVALQTGRGLIVGDDEGFCFFWNSSDRIFILGASHMKDEDAVAIANSMRVSSTE